MPDIRAQLFFRRPVSVVYRAWTEPAQLAEWIDWPKECKVVADKPRLRLAFDWPGGTKIEVRFQPTDDGARVDFLHFGFADDKEGERAHRRQKLAWQVAFGRLQTYLG